MKIGSKFGKLTVIKKTEKRKHKSIVWECKCDCGNICYYYTKQLTSGEKTNCGCEKKHSHVIDLTGKKFGKLTVIELSHLDKRNRTRWKCKCDCGNEKIIPGETLRKGKSKSCGCLQKEVATKRAIEMYNNHKVEALKEGTNLSSLTSRIPKNNTSGHKGVTFQKKSGRWIAFIGFKNKQIYLGSYRRFEDAVRAREEAEEKYFKPILKKYNKE